MFVFERRFHRGMLILLVIQVILSFFTIYLLERMASDENRIPIEVDLGLRRNMNTLLSQLHDDKAGYEDWNLAWSKALVETGHRLHEARYPVKQLLQVSQLDSRLLHQDAALRRQAEEGIMKLASAYDSHWAQAHKTFRLAVIGGAWSVTLMSLLAFISLAYIHGQIKRYLLLPLREICHCLIDWKRGNRLRRCSVIGIDPNVQRSMDILNKTLDEHRPPKVMTPIERHFDEDEL